MNFFEYLKKNKIFAAVFGLLTVLVYMPLIANNSYCADVEYVINQKGSIYNWNELGRYTLILIKKICFSSYNVYVESILFALCMFFTVSSLSYLIFRANKRIPAIISYFLAGITLIYPTFTEQFYFKFQSFEVCLGILLLVIADILLLDFVRKSKIRLFIISVLLITLSFGIYQSMLNISLTLYIGVFLLLVFSEDIKKFPKYALTFVGSFIASFVLNKIITRIFCQEGSYFTDKIMWLQYPIDTCYHFVKHYIRVVIFAEKHVYSYTFMLAILISLFALIFMLIKAKNKNSSNLRITLMILCLVGLFISPFIISIIQGFEPDSRTQLALSFSVSFMFAFSFSTLDHFSFPKELSKRLLYIFVFISTIILSINIVHSTRLVHSRMLINKSDNRYLEVIANDLSEFNCKNSDESSVPVILIGSLPTESDFYCFTYDVENKDYILMAVFSLDADTEPKYFFSTNRIMSAMNLRGYDYKKPDLSHYMDEAYALSLDMPAFPNDGYIQETDNFVVVNLGNSDNP